jgi:thioredoxin-like negative regulator of GroEL
MTSPIELPDKMTLLLNQEEFEILLGRIPTEKPIPPLVVLYFTAPWCKACKKLDLPLIQGTLPKATWMKCDIDQNDYTPGFCGIRSIPTFLVIRETKIMGQLSNSNTETVVEWLKRFAE